MGFSVSVVNRMVLGKRPIRERELTLISTYFRRDLFQILVAKPSSSAPAGCELLRVVGIAEPDVWI